ncbi:hypothetical protein PMAYCL1PPCAC_18839, partial [Pristionchus mayeri]
CLGCLTAWAALLLLAAAAALQLHAATAGAPLGELSDLSLVSSSLEVASLLTAALTRGLDLQHLTDKGGSSLLAPVPPFTPPDGPDDVWWRRFTFNFRNSLLRSQMMTPLLISDNERSSRSRDAPCGSSFSSCLICSSELTPARSVGAEGRECVLSFSLHSSFCSTDCATALDPPTTVHCESVRCLRVARLQLPRLSESLLSPPSALSSSLSSPS